MPFGGESADSYYDDGVTAFMKGDIAQAVTCFGQAARLDPSMVSARHQLARCDMRMGRMAEAIPVLEDTVQAKPFHVPPRVDLAMALIAVGRTVEARALLEETLVSAPGNNRVLLGLAHTSFDQGHWQGALDFARQALDHGGPSFPVLFIMGKAARLTGDDALSIECLTEAAHLIDRSVELSPGQPEAYYLRGELLFAREQFGPAIDAFRAAVDRADRDRYYGAFGESFTRVDALARLGVCFQRLGRDAEAREIGEQILKLEPGHKLAHALTGKIVS